LRQACLANKVVPMVCGSSFKNKGVQTMLDLVMELMPSPLDKENIKGTHPDTEEEVSRKPDAKEPFTALAFKIATDPYVGRLAYFRCYAGRLDEGSYVLNTRSGNKERISRIFQMHANKQNQIPFIEAGDIGAAVGFKDIKTGDTLCAENAPIVLEAMNFPEPVIGLAIEAKTQADQDKMGVALGKLAECRAGAIEQHLPADLLAPLHKRRAVDAGRLVVMEFVCHAVAIQPDPRLLHGVAVFNAVDGYGPALAHSHSMVAGGFPEIS